MDKHVIVKLNVGGHRFETTSATLRSVPNTYFAGLATLAKDDTGSVFIDRYPHFESPCRLENWQRGTVFHSGEPVPHFLWANIRCRDGQYFGPILTLSYKRGIEMRRIL